MTLDFFIHPEYPEEEYGSVNNNYGRYIHALEQVASSSDAPFLVSVYPHSDARIRPTIPRENFAISWQIGFYDLQLCTTGYIEPNSWDAFTSFLSKKPSDEIRIHGAYAGQCVTGFAVQLFAYLHRREHWRSDLFDEESNERENKLERIHVRNGDFRRSRIRFGVVALSEARKIIAPPRILFRRAGNINYQLTDEKTTFHEVH